MSYLINVDSMLKFLSNWLMGPKQLSATKTSPNHFSGLYFAESNAEEWSNVSHWDHYQDHSLPTIKEVDSLSLGFLGCNTNPLCTWNLTGSFTRMETRDLIQPNAYAACCPISNKALWLWPMGLVFFAINHGTTVHLISF